MAGQHRPTSQKARADASVMGTNNSSIVSKRSVERLYYQEPHFYRYFVKKPQRRSPLINRGYWLRMHALEQVIKHFLDEPSKKRKKIILNLGCGYDPIPFQWLSRHPSRCQDVTFVDVDYPDLMEKKCDIISNTSQLRDLLGPFAQPLDPDGLLLRSERYLAIGCDLADCTTLDMILANEFQMSDCLVLCTAEVSLTYMDTNTADALIQWAALHDDICFCLLEQFLPHGADHPFAQKMIRHFNNLHTPLRSIHQYPQLADQEKRFLKSHWTSVSARNLWDLWSDDLFVSPEKRLALNDAEPFDEWEEFVLFASHYFLLLAANTSPLTGPSPSFLGHLQHPNYPTCAAFSAETAEVSLELKCEAFPSSYRRRFGALTSLSRNTFGHHGGLGIQTRLSKMNVYVLPETQPSDLVDMAALEEKCCQLGSLAPRMCHTITSESLGFLVVGGRASPDHALKDCWLSRKNYWQRVEDLPIPLFRHCATTVALENLGTPADNGILIYGGKSASNHVSGQWLLWREGFGWTNIPVSGDLLEPRFSAVMQETGFRRGILLGGMANDGKILSEAYEWSISGDTRALSISLSRLAFSRPDTHLIIGRLGASLIDSKFGILLVGGVSSGLIPRSFEVIRLSRGKSTDNEKDIWNWAPIEICTTGQRPLLIGHNVFAYSDAVAILGGGAVCFSFGTFWNESILIMSDCDQAPRPLRELTLQEPSRFRGREPTASIVEDPHLGDIIPQDDKVESSQNFEHILNHGQPVIMRNMALGSCTTEWTLENLIAMIGRDRVVVVHEASDESFLDFQSKNFKYTKKSFKTFVEEISQGSPQYLRSLSSENPAGKPADISADFPELDSSFRLPPQLKIVQQRMHSSVLRVSGPVMMWLHYDVMANVLCQIRGSKRLILYPPSDVSLFAIPPGTSSSSINCFDTGPNRHPSLTLAHPREALLQPGEVLFIPPLWLHTVSPANNNINISVNVFFRNLDTGYATGRDVYGNRDLQAYEKGRRDIEKISKSFDKLPLDMSKFYIERLANELKEKAQNYSSLKGRPTSS